jgi:outer membrane protein assembly factor BamB
MKQLLALLGFWPCLVLGQAEPENWPQFRGGQGDGLATGATLPEEWSATENVVWKTDIPGWGWSSPIVWGQQIIATSAVSEKKLPMPHVGGYPGGHIKAEAPHRYMLYCLDFDSGKIIWEVLLHHGIPPQQRHPRNSFASETPVTDGQRVFAYFANIGLFCYSMDGKTKLWERRWPSYPMRDGWNTGTSPVIHENLIFIQNDNETSSFIEAIDITNGSVVWRMEREEKSTWSTPYIWKTEERSELVTIGSNRIRSYNPSNGELIWELSGTSGLVSQTPMAVGGLLYVGAGYHYGPLYAVRPGAKGDISLKADEKNNDFIVWYQRRGSSIHPSYVVSGERLFVCYDSGLVACFDAKTGAPIFGRQRLDTMGGRFYASPWAYKGHIYMLNENGTTWVIRDSDKFEIVRKNSLGDDVAWSTPAIARGSLFLRTYSSLYRLQKQLQDTDNK